jgi:hypothetical protein
MHAWSRFPAVGATNHDMTTLAQFLCSLSISSRLDSSLKEKNLNGCQEPRWYLGGYWRGPANALKRSGAVCSHHAGSMNAAFAVGRGVGTAFDARGLRVAFVGVLKNAPNLRLLKHRSQIIIFREHCVHASVARRQFQVAT